MDILYLRAFIRLSETRHLSQTASEFGVPKGTLWKYINRVEAELGVRLYEHSRKRVILTDDGERFLATAKAIVARIDECSAGLGQGRVKDGEKQQLRIGTFVMMTPYGITDQLIDFKQGVPDLDIRIHQNDEQMLQKQLDDGLLELAYVRSWGEPDSRFESLLVTTDEACIVLPRAHPLAQRGFVRWSELKGEKFFLISEGGPTYRECIKCCERAGFMPEVGGTFFSADTVLRMVEQGMGISFLLRRPSRRFGYMPGVVFKNTEPPCILKIYLLRTKKYESGGIAADFWNCVKNSRSGGSGHEA